MAHKIEVIETVTRTYHVEDAGGDTAEQSAKDRLHLWFRDPELLKDGIVSRQDGETVSSRRIKNAEKLKAPPAAVPPAPAA